MTSRCIVAVAASNSIAAALVFSCAPHDHPDQPAQDTGDLADFSSSDAFEASTEVNDLGIASDGAEVDDRERVAQVAVGGIHSCARFTKGASSSLRCWGTNASGQIGDGTQIGPPGPVVIAIPSTPPSTLPAVLRGVALGYAHSCATHDDGSAHCWGDNRSGQLGDGTTTNRPSPTLVAGISNAQQLSLGGAHTCARTREGGVTCWGRNQHGQLGDGSSADRIAPTPIASIDLGGAITSLALGGAHTCGRRADGRVLCWGSNKRGQLGDGTTVDRLAATLVSGLSDATSVAAGSSHTCAVVAGGTVSCWGANESGQLGDATKVERALPKTVNSLMGAADVALGTSHSCATRSDGTAACWGSNGSGQLGDDTFDSRLTATNVPGFVGVAELALGVAHTCARTVDGSVFCWGWNMSRQLGDGTILIRTVPTAVKW